MMLAQNIGHAEANDRLPVLGVLAFLWLLAAVLSLMLIGISFAPEHAVDGLKQLNDLLPTDQSLWVGFTA